MHDDLETGTYMDLEWFTVSDNGTHLIITARWSGAFPSGTPTTYSLERDLWFNLDLDNNRKTGCCPGQPDGGYEIGVSAYRDLTGQGLGVILFSSNGSYLGGEDHPEWLSANDTSMNISIPLTT